MYEAEAQTEPKKIRPDPPLLISPGLDQIKLGGM
jgi:hypothetical protein